MGKHLSEDEIKYVVTAETNEAQKNIFQLEKKVKDLTKEEKDRRSQMIELEARGKKNTKAYKNLSEEADKYKKQIRELNKEIAAETKKLDVNSMTMNQLKKRAKDLQRQLDNTAQALHPQKYAELEKQLHTVKDRMENLKFTAKSMMEVFANDNILNYALGNAYTKIASFVFAMADRVKEFVKEGVEMARSADGIENAFERLNRPDLLDNLRKATRGTVDDVELMKAAVQANDFRIPLDQLGKYLAFAQLKASQTGQSVDYLTNSIITGLGRKSPQILDNLGISASELKEEMAKGGDMATAVGVIIDRQLEAQGDHYEDAAERSKRAATEVANAQREIGETLLPIQEKGETLLSSLQAGTLRWANTILLKVIPRMQLWADKFVELYNSSIKFRAEFSLFEALLKSLGVLISVNFKLIFVGLENLATYLKTVSDMIEGVFLLDGEKVKGSWNNFTNLVVRGVKQRIGLVYDAGKEIADAFSEGYNATINGKMKKLDWSRPQGATDNATELQIDPQTPAVNPKKVTSPKDDSAVSTITNARSNDIHAEDVNYQRNILELKKKLLNDEKYTQEQYDIDERLEKQRHYVTLVSIEELYCAKVQELRISDGNKKLHLQEQQSKNLEQAQQQSFDAQLDAQRTFQRLMGKLQKSATDDKTTDPIEQLKAEKEAQKLVLKGYYEAALEYAVKNGLDTQTVEAAYISAKENLDLQYAKKKKDLELKTQQELLQIRQQYGLVTQAELYQEQMRMLEQQLEEGKLKEEEYEKAKTNLKRDCYKQQYDYYNKLFSDAVSALQDAEIANINAKYDAEIEAAKGNEEEVERLENEKARKTLDIQKKYADVNFAIKASQIIADTTVSIMKAYADLGPIAGSVAAALMGVTGAAQLAAANAERQKVKKMTLNNAGGEDSSKSGTRVATGLEKGGSLDVIREQDGKEFRDVDYDPDRRGFIDHPTVIVGEGPVGRSKEFVASNAAVENPTVAPVLAAIDQAQRAGTIRTLDVNKVMQLPAFSGKETGGSISASSTGSLGGSSMTAAPLQSCMSAEERELLEKVQILLQYLIDNGVDAFVVLSELEKKQLLLEKARKIGSK